MLYGVGVARSHGIADGLIHPIKNLNPYRLNCPSFVSNLPRCCKCVDIHAPWHTVVVGKENRLKGEI